MKILYDCQIFVSQRFGGISRYYASLARELHKNQHHSPLILAPRHENEYLGFLPDEIVSGRKWSMPSLPLSVRYASNLALSLIPAGRFSPDVLHHTYYYPLALRNRKAAVVTTVHDLIHEKFPDGLEASRAFRLWKARSVREADHIICVSENTKRDVLLEYDVDERKVSVVYHGYDPQHAVGVLSPIAPNRQPFHTAPYILFVGVRTAYKNFLALLSAFASSSVMQELDLFCFGGGPFTDAERSSISNFGLGRKVHQMDGTEEQLSFAYAGARLLAYPSLYEGFGFPLLEAMTHGCPVACSCTGSLPEIAGNAAEYFDPEDTESIRTGVEKLVLSEHRRNQLIELGNQRCLHFSWEECAAQTSSVYSKLR